jgi:hypothetical protein
VPEVARVLGQLAHSLGLGFGDFVAGDGAHVASDVSISLSARRGHEDGKLSPEELPWPGVMEASVLLAALEGRSGPSPKVRDLGGSYAHRLPIGGGRLGRQAAEDAELECGVGERLAAREAEDFRQL